MKRSLRKAIAFVLALGMVVTGMPVSAQAAPTDKAEAGSVTTLAEAVYDEAVTFSDSVAFLQNGHWSDDGQSNISADTTIVFMDAQGNKTELKNNDGNGNMLFDAIYPMISVGYHQYDAFKVIKDGKMSYIRTDANHPYYGTSLQWYTYARPINDEYVIVSDDNTTYRVLNTAGEVVKGDLKNFSYASAIGNCVYLKCGYAVYVICPDGTVKNYDRFDDEQYSFQNLGNGYAMVDAEEYTVLLDKDGKIVESFQMVANPDGDGSIKVRGLYADAIAAGYVIRLVENRVNNSSYYYYDVWNLNTDSVVVKCTYKPEFDGSVILGADETRNRFLMSVDGTVYYANLDNYVTENLATESYEQVTYSFYYVNESLLISMRDEADGVETETYVLTKETAFADGAKKHLSGIVHCFSYDEDYVMTSDNNCYIDTMATTKGAVVKEYGDTNYGYAYALKKEYSDETRTFYDEIDGFPFRVSVRDKQNGGYSLGHSYITDDGVVHGAREIPMPTGNFIVDYSISGEGVKVINTDNKVVYENGDVLYGDVEAFWYHDYFTVNLEGRVYLYDREGNLVLGKDAVYTAIGNDEIEGYYPAHGNDYYGAFDYYNEALANGICVVKVVTNDVVKYGAISLGDTSLNGLIQAEDGTWYYYIDGEIAYDYTGLVQHYDAWFYVENGVLNWNYTGLTLFNGVWFYVQNGQLNWGYTGLVEHFGAWFYVEGGVLNWNYTGLVQHYDAWFYVENGQLNWGYTGLVQHYGAWFYVQNGQLNWGYTGLVQHYDAWFYVEGGQLNWNYTGLVNYNGIWFYVENGQLNWGYTGLVQYAGAWFYVQNGQLNWAYTGLVQYYDAWFYVNGGQLDWGYTGLCEYNGLLFYIQGGQLNWGYTGTVEYNGVLWYVENGIAIRVAQ